MILVGLTLIDLILDPEWLSQINIVLFSVIHLLIGSVIAILIGFRSSGNMKSRIDYLYMMIM